MKTETREASTLGTTWTFEGCDADVQERLRTGWRAQSIALESLLEPLGATRRRLTMFVHAPARPGAGYQVRAVLHLPTGVLVAEHGEEEPESALASVAEGLRREVRKHRRDLRRDHVVRFKSRHRSALNAADSRAPGKRPRSAPVARSKMRTEPSRSRQPSRFPSGEKERAVGRPQRTANSRRKAPVRVSQSCRGSPSLPRTGCSEPKASGCCGRWPMPTPSCSRSAVRP